MKEKQIKGTIINPDKKLICRKITLEKLKEYLALIDWKIGSCGDECFTFINHLGNRANLYGMFFNNPKEARLDIWSSQELFGKGDADYDKTGAIHFYLKYCFLDAKCWRSGWISLMSGNNKKKEVGLSFYNFSDEFKNKQKSSNP